jgi:DinB superfamily
LIPQLLFLIDSAYDHVSWHGPNLRGSIRGVTPQQAAWRPGADRHNIWELVVHAAYWKYAVLRRLTGAKRGTFPRKGSNWLPVPSPASTAAWKRDVAMLGEMHRELRKVVGGLKELTPRRRRLIAGVAFHDVYHAGQIQYVKRLVRARLV